MATPRLNTADPRNAGCSEIGNRISCRSGCTLRPSPASRGSASMPSAQSRIDMTVCRTWGVDCPQRLLDAILPVSASSVVETNVAALSAECRVRMGVKSWACYAALARRTSFDRLTFHAPSHPALVASAAPTGSGFTRKRHRTRRAASERGGTAPSNRASRSRAP